MFRQTTYLVFLLFLVLMSQIGFPGLVSSPANAGSLAVMQLEHRAAEEALPVVQQLLTAKGSATADRRTNSLVVVDTEPALDRVRGFLLRFDRPVAQLRVHVRFDDAAVGTNRSILAEGRLEGRAGSIGTPSAKKEGVQVQIDAGAMTRGERADYSILVESGRPAFILTGTDIPYRTFWVDYRRRYARAGSSVEFHRIDTGFEVLPTLAGDHVLLEITPRISGLAEHGPSRQVVRFAEASTRLRAPLGQWVAIGGTRQEKTQALQAFIKAGQSDERQSGSIFLMVEKE